MSELLKCIGIALLIPVVIAAFVGLVAGPGWAFGDTVGLVWCGGMIFLALVGLVWGARN